MEFINTLENNNTDNNSGGDNKNEEQHTSNENKKNYEANTPSLHRGRRDSTSMLLTAALGEFENNSLRQSRLSMSMFDDDPSIRESLRSFSNSGNDNNNNSNNNNNNTNNHSSSTGNLLSKNNQLESAIVEELDDREIGNISLSASQEARSRRFSNRSLSKRSSFLKDSIDLNAELMMGAFSNKSSKETTGEPKLHQSEDDFLKFNIPELNKNLIASTSPYMGPSQHKPSLGFNNRKFSFGGLIGGRKDSVSADGVMESFLALHGKDDDLFLTQRRNSSLSAMMRPSIIGLDKYKSLQNENAISDGEEDEFENNKEKLKKTPNSNTTNNNINPTSNKVTPISTSVSREMSVINEADTVKDVAPVFATPVMLIKNQHPPSTLNPSSIKDNTILESTKKMSIPNTLHQADSDISAYARLDFADSTFYVQTLKVTLGRKPNTNDPSQTGVVTAQQVNDSNKDNVDVNLGSSKNISRKHAQIYYNFANEQFEMTVLGKNGAFVNDEFIGKNVTVVLNNDTKIQIANIPFIFVQDASSISEYGNTDRFKTKEEIDNENNIKKENAKKAINEKKRESLKKKREEKAALEMLAKQQQLHLKGQQQKKLLQQKEKEKTNKRAAQVSMTVLSPKETTPKRVKKKEYLPEEIPLEYREKPNIPYNTMILETFKKFTKAEGETMSLTNIYDTLKEIYPYYEYCSKGWQSSVRHALQTNRTFTKGPKEGKSWLWMVDSNYLREKELEEKTIAEEKRKIEEANREAKRKFFQRLPKALNHKETQDAKQKRTLVYLQQQLMILTTDRQGLDKETISQVLTKALASTIQKVNEVSKKIGMTKHPLGFLMDKNPQQLNFILAAACNASLKEVTGDKNCQIVKLPTPQELARDLDEAKKEYFEKTGKVWEQPKDIKPPMKKLTLKQQRLKEAQMKVDAAEAALKKIQDMKTSSVTAPADNGNSISAKPSSAVSRRRNIPTFAGIKKENSNELISKSSTNFVVKSESPKVKPSTFTDQFKKDSLKRKAESDPNINSKKIKIENKETVSKQAKAPLGPTTSVINLQPNMKNTSVSSSGKQTTTLGMMPKKPVSKVVAKPQMVSKAPVYRPSSVNFDPTSLSKFFQAKNHLKVNNANLQKNNSNEQLVKPTVTIEKPVPKPVLKPKKQEESSEEETTSSDESGSSDDSDSSDDDDD
ncbi:hypothetical protein ACO0SA_001235 [Hanseniaspora valbyensis]